MYIVWDNIEIWGNPVLKYIVRDIGVYFVFGGFGGPKRPNQKNPNGQPILSNVHKKSKFLFLSWPDLKQKGAKGLSGFKP